MTISGGRSHVLLPNELRPQSDKSLEFHPEKNLSFKTPKT